MSAVITMSAAIDESIRECCVEAVSQAVEALAAKYGFDAAEAQTELNLGELKIQRKRGPAPKKPACKPAKSKTSGEPKSKRKITGYLLFSREHRDEVKSLLLDELEEGEKLKPQAVVGELAEQWKALSEEEQQQFKDRAAEEAAESDDSQE